MQSKKKSLEMQMDFNIPIKLNLSVIGQGTKFKAKKVEEGGGDQIEPPPPMPSRVKRNFAE